MSQETVVFLKAMSDLTLVVSNTEITIKSFCLDSEPILAMSVFCGQLSQLVNARDILQNTIKKLTSQSINGLWFRYVKSEWSAVKQMDIYFLWKSSTCVQKFDFQSKISLLSLIATYS